MRILLILILLITQQALAYSVNVDFFKRFNDCYIEKYIYEALEKNHDLKQANYKVEQFRQEVKSSLANELPSLSVSSNYLGAHFPKGDTNFLLKRNSFILPFMVNYEPDFLLKNRDKTKSQKYLFKSQVANQKGTYISLLTDVASTYVNILLLDYLINRQEEILKNKDSNLSFTFNKFNFGVVDLINLNNSKEELNAQKIIYENLIKQRNTLLYNFAVLIGESPANIDEIERGELKNFEYTETIPTEISSDKIYVRPDIIEVENKLKSAKLDVTVAKKEFFPSFNITGFLAFDTAGGGNFFSWNSSFAYLVAGATQDIFKGGAKIANLKIKKARYCELVELYKQTDLIAIKEINNALNIIYHDKKAELEANNQLEIEKRIMNISNRKLKSGVISRTEFLNDKNSYNQQQQLTAASKASRLIDYFTLYKAVGGDL